MLGAKTADGALENIKSGKLFVNSKTRCIAAKMIKNDSACMFEEYMKEQQYLQNRQP
jgi:hypothetical protein